MGSEQLHILHTGPTLRDFTEQEHLQALAFQSRLEMRQ